MLTLPSMFLIIGVTVALLLGVCSLEYCEDTEKIVVVFGDRWQVLLSFEFKSSVFRCK